MAPSGMLTDSQGIRLMSMMNIVQAHELAEELGISELQLQQIALQKRLPFSFSMACGFFSV